MQLHIPSEQPHVPKRVSEVPELLVAQSLDGRSIDGARRRARSQPGPPNRLLVSTSTPTLTLASITRDLNTLFKLPETALSLDTQDGVSWTHSGDLCPCVEHHTRPLLQLLFTRVPLSYLAVSP